VLGLHRDGGMATEEDFGDVIKAIKRGQVPTRAFNTHRATLAELASVLPQWADPSGGVIKGMIDV
jgi:threonine dehydrogenase-like Zn-dependent dehydrogenase